MSEEEAEEKWLEIREEVETRASDKDFSDEVLDPLTNIFIESSFQTAEEINQEKPPYKKELDGLSRK